VKTGLQASALGNIRAEIWWKALGNLAVNPISAISKRDDDRDLALSRNARPRAQDDAGRAGNRRRDPLLLTVLAFLGLLW
jgi:hypothetical protein